MSWFGRECWLHNYLNLIALFYLLGIFQTAQWETAVYQNSEKSLEVDFADINSIEFGTYELSKLRKRNFYEDQ